MGRLMPRIRQGFTRLAWVIAGWLAFWVVTATLHASGGGRLLAPGLERFGVFTVFLFVAAFGWVWNGFRTDPPPRERAEALRTKRLVMRRILPVDVARLHEILSDPETMRYWHRPAHEDHEVTAAWLQQIIVPADPTLCDDFVVLHRSHVIGLLGSMRLPWVSFVFDKSVWRQGFAGEALAAYAAYMFARGLPYLRAATDVNNAAAQALLRGAGFRETGRTNGVWRVQGEPSEAVHYRLNRDGAEPDAEEERATIARMEEARAAADLAATEDVAESQPAG